MQGGRWKKEARILGVVVGDGREVKIIQQGKIDTLQSIFSTCERFAKLNNSVGNDPKRIMQSRKI